MRLLMESRIFIGFPGIRIAFRSPDSTRHFRVLPSLSETPAHLQRRLGLLQSAALNMTNMVGVGPFITIPLLMATMGGPQALIGWLAALVLCAADALVWSELGAAFPGSGGTYYYLRQ